MKDFMRSRCLGFLRAVCAHLATPFETLMSNSLYLLDPIDETVDQFSSKPSGSRNAKMKQSTGITLKMLGRQTLKSCAGSVSTFRLTCISPILVSSASLDLLSESQK